MTDWSDDRLTEAFRARAVARPTPPDLTQAAIDRVRRAAPRTRSGLGFGSVGALAAAAAVVVVVGAIAIGQLALEPGEDATDALGLPILSVTEAIAIHDSDPGDREIAVRGFFSPAQPLSCPAPVGPRFFVNPIRLDCPLPTQWLMEAPERLATKTQDSIQGRGPSGPAFHPVFPFLDMSIMMPPGDASAPVEIVVIGHFHDRRGDPDTALCGATNEAGCDSFVVDGIYSVAGRRVPSSTLIDVEPLAPEPRTEPTWTPVDVDRMLVAAVPRLDILSRVALPGHRIHELEPSLGTGALGIIDHPVVWVVTGLDTVASGSPPVRRTFLIVDGTTEAYETVPWDVEPNVGFAPFAFVPSTPSPTASTKITLDLELGGWHQRVEIVDESGLLVSATPIVPGVDPAANMPDGGDIAVASVGGHPERIRLDWLGGACDSPLRFTIPEGGRTIVVESLPFEGDTGNLCILIGVPRGVTLTFSEPVPASEVEIVRPASAEILPVAVMGMPVIGVPEAIEHRDNHLDDTEILVKGWLVAFSIACLPEQPPLTPAELQTTPAEATCPDGWVWLAELPPVEGRAGPVSPAQPAFNLLLRPESHRLVVEAVAPGQPSEVIVMGHFDDHRAINCPAERIEECRRNFIVDAILDPIRPWFTRIAIESFRPDPALETIARPEDVIRSIGDLQGPRGRESVIASFAVRGSAVASFEPQAAQSADVTSATAVWVIRHLETVLDERPIIRTRLVIDGPVESLRGSIYVPTPGGLMRETTIID